MAASRPGTLGALLVGALAGAIAGSLVTLVARPDAPAPDSGTASAQVELDEQALAGAIARANEPLRDEIRSLEPA